MADDRPFEAPIVRRVFEAWSIAVPMGFEETFIEKDQYWHAWGEGGSVSLTSIVITEAGRPVPAADIAQQAFRALTGVPVEEGPPDVLGRAVLIDVRPPTCASRALAGILVIEGRSLLVTITSDDLEWATRTWLSIRNVPHDSSRHGAPCVARHASWGASRSRRSD